MKKIALMILITLNGVALGIGSVSAGQVGTLIDFQAGTPAVADDVDQNFSDVREEVNDNDNRITTNTSKISTNTTAIQGNTTAIKGNATAIQGKQNRVAGTCPAGQSIREIAENGTVTCEVDDVGGGTEAGLLDWSQPGMGFIDVNSLGVRDVDPDTVLREIDFVSPADGYIMITVTGRGCIHTNGGYIELFLKSGNDYLNYVGFYSVRGVGGACGVGESTQFSWQYIEPVSADTVCNFEVAGHKGSSATISGNVTIASVAAVFLPGL